ncbi:MAG: nitroreductase family protein [archaeon]|nr:nitroreductase family protein [archaeon]
MRNNKDRIIFEKSEETLEDLEKYSRTAEYPINDLFFERWSPSHLSGEEIEIEELMPLFEAAKWAPSAHNNQPWRFLFAMRGTPNWKLFFNLLSDVNKKWAKDASALIIILSKKTFDNGKPSMTHSFDTGAAWENLALQGFLMGYAVHGMDLFDYDQAKKKLNIPNSFQIEAMAAVGKPHKKTTSEEMEIYRHPSPRKKTEEIFYEGKFPRGDFQN